VTGLQAALDAKAALAGATFSGDIAAPTVRASAGGFFASGWAGNTNAGVIFLNAANDRYLFYDGSSYQLPGAALNVNGAPVWTSATFNPSAYLAKAGGTMGGQLRVTVDAAYASAEFINNASNTTDGAGSVCLLAQSSLEPAIGFYRTGVIATKIGMNTANQLSIGGWSWAANRVTIDSAGNIGATGSVSAANFLASSEVQVGGATYFATATVGNAFAAFADGASSYFRFTGGYNFAYERSTGYLRWYAGGSVAAAFAPNGDFAVTGAFNSSGVTTGPLNCASVTSSGAMSCASLSSGGNIAGTRIDGTAIYSSGLMQAAGPLYVYNDISFGLTQGGGFRYQFYAANWYWRCLQGGGALEWIGDRGIGQQVFFNFRNDAAFLMSFDLAYKPGGGVWGDSSDERIKTVLCEYDSGLDAILALQPVVYTFKGNDTPAPPAAGPSRHDEEPQPAPKAAPFPNSPHYGVATEGQEFIGLIAQAVEAVMPEMVTRRDGFIDGQAVTDLRDLNTGPLVFALINAIKELTARIEALETRT